jgi:ABC-type amino acid transport substrate-binding protein
MRRAGKIGNVRVYQFSQLTEAIADLRAGRIAAVMKVSPAASWLFEKRQVCVFSGRSRTTRNLSGLASTVPIPHLSTL